MKFRTLGLALTLVLFAAFAVLNWAAISAPTDLSIGFAQVRAPLGLILLLAVGVVSGLFLIYIVFQQAGVIFEARRYAKELKGHRELADTAEASRFTALQTFLDGELRRIEGQQNAASQQIDARLEQLEQRLSAKHDESTRVLSAYVGQMDDKLDRVLEGGRS